MKSTLFESPPTEEEGGGGGLQEDGANKKNNGLQSHLELRLGISFNNRVEGIVNSSASNSDGKEGGGGGGGQSPNFLITQDGSALQQRNRLGLGGSKRWFSETGGSFIDPWSLAGRQEKAVLEQQAHQKLKASSSFVPRISQPPPPPPPPPVVGWPPIRTFRKNLTASQVPKTEIDAETNLNKMTTTKGEDMSNKVELSPTMYVKVSMEGLAVGRKIDLKAHHSYDSLSRALQKMFHNFLSANYSNNSKQDEGEEIINPGYILLYQDNEGDCLLVGDVPWEMFVTSVKRLYIVHDPRAPKKVNGRLVS